MSAESTARNASIDLYYWPTPNGWKVSIMLEECGLAYNTIDVDIGGGDQFTPEFLRISPNNRMPALVDHAPLGGGEPLALFESGAILEYLADKSGLFLAASGPERYRALQWVHWQMANLGPMMGNANHFKNYGKNIADDPKQLEYGTKRFVGEVDRLCGVMDAQLLANEYLAGSEYTIADIITWPWAMLAGRLLDEALWETFPNLKRWVDLVGARAAVQQGFALRKELRERKLTEAEEQARRELLFNQTNDKVRAAREQAAQSV
ncbi:MAG: glutathione S-transferase N-terminal domain-containing protein [Pseudomonadales bacterium]